MAKKLTPQQSREEARALIEKAKKKAKTLREKASLEEERRYILVGKLAAKKILSKDFEVGHLEDFKSQIKKILYE